MSRTKAKFNPDGTYSTRQQLITTHVYKRTRACILVIIQPFGQFPSEWPQTITQCFDARKLPMSIIKLLCPFDGHNSG